MNLYKNWINHLKENNMTYLQHSSFALYHGFICLLAGFYLVVHAFLPCFFLRTGSDLLKRLSQSFNQDNNDTIR
jgi:hypothetical protein